MKSFKYLLSFSVLLTVNMINARERKPTFWQKIITWMSNPNRAERAEKHNRLPTL